jgi:hypothetical protein
MPREKYLYFQDFLNYYEHVEVLRLLGLPWGEPHQAMAGQFAREGLREDRRPDLVHVRDAGSGMARTICKLSKGVAKDRRIESWINGKSVSSVGFLWSREMGVYYCSWGDRKGQVAQESLAGGL